MTTNVPMQAPPVAGQVVLYQPGAVRPPSPLNRKAALITGYMQIALAVVSLAFGVACISSGYFQGIVGIPIWGALGFYLVAGILGVVAAQSKRGNECVVVGCLVMSVLAAVTAFFHVIIGSIDTAYEYRFYYDYHYGNQGSFFAINILTIMVGVIQFVTAIVTAVFMCSGATCCCGQPTPNGVGQQQYASYIVQPGQVVNQGYPMMQQQFVGQSMAMGQTWGQPQVMGQPQVVGQPQQNVQYMGQASGQLPAYTEHETKEVPKI